MNLVSPKVKSFSPQSVSKSQATVFELVIMIVVLAVGYPYLVAPKVKEYRDTKDKLVAVTKDSESFENTKRDLENLKKKLADPKNKKNIAVLSEALPLQTRITRTYILMEDMVKKPALSLGNLVVDQTADIGGVNVKSTSPYAAARKLSTVNLNVSVTGTMEQFRGFLTILENDNRVLDIQNLEIAPVKEDTLSFHMQVKTYLYAPQ